MRTRETSRNQRFIRYNTGAPNAREVDICKLDQIGDLSHSLQRDPTPGWLKVKYRNFPEKMKRMEAIQWTLMYSDFYLDVYIHKLLLLFRLLINILEA